MHSHVAGCTEYRVPTPSKLNAKKLPLEKLPLSFYCIGPPQSLDRKIHENWKKQEVNRENPEVKLHKPEARNISLEALFTSLITEQIVFCSGFRGFTSRFSPTNVHVLANFHAISAKKSFFKSQSLQVWTEFVGLRKYWINTQLFYSYACYGLLILGLKFNSLVLISTDF